MPVANIARRIVPEWLRQPLKRLYALAPIERRMSKEYWKLKSFIQEAQWWERDRITAWQFNKLKEIVNYAYRTVPAYHLLYKDAGITPDDIVSLDDIQLLPPTSKELLRENLEDFTSREVSSSQRNYSTTGGSTGEPFGFYQTEVNRWMEDAFIHSGWERAGWQLGDRSAVLRGRYVGSEEHYWDHNHLRCELLLSSYYLTEWTFSKYREKIQEVSPKHLQAYPSVATILADILAEQGDEKKFDFEVILLGSENIYEWQKDLLREAFPAIRLFGWYGHAEQVVLAPWCENSEQYHVWPFYGIVEVLDSGGKEVSRGGIGEIVGTSFWNYATPFIRYQTSDRAMKNGWGCEECGRQFLILDSIEGRLQEMIVTETGRYITMTAINMHSDVFDNVRQFQFYQDTRGKVVFRVLRKDTYTKDDTEKIERELKKKLGDDMLLEISFVDEIPRTRQGKLGVLEQKLDIRYGE